MRIVIPDMGKNVFEKIRSFDALQSSFDKLTADHSELEGKFTTLTAERDVLLAKVPSADVQATLDAAIAENSKLAADTVSLNAQIASAVADKDKLKTEFDAYKAKDDERASAKAQQILGNAGVPPVSVKDKGAVASMSRADFSALNAEQQAAHVRKGGKIHD